MPIGQDASAEGYPLVPDSGEDGKVKWGAREINLTRDLIAVVKRLIPVGKAGYRTASGFTDGTAAPDDAVGDDGDIYLQVIEP